MICNVDEKMAWDIPSLDPNWVSVLANLILVIITIFYVWHTKKMVDLAKMTLNLDQMSLIYQRKPNVLVKIDNKENDIRCSIKNNENSISPISNIDVKLDLKIKHDKFFLGKYHVRGPLLPGEEDTPDLTKMIRKLLMILKLMESRIEKDISVTDEKGYPYFPTFYDITKSQIEFDILIKMSFDTDIKIRKDRRLTISRIFSVELNEEFAPPNSAFDLYTTNIRMKSGEWS